MSSESLDRLVNNRFAPANLYQKLINVDADLSDKTLKGNTGILKKLTGGDELETEEKYKKAFSFVNHAKLIFSCNTIPETDDETDAFFRRLIIINFTTQFFEEKEDPALIGKLCTEEEFSGLLLVLLDRLPRVLEKGLRSTSDKGISETYEKYVRGSNTVRYFKEKAIIDTDSKAHFVSKDDVYSAYVLFCKVSGVTVESSNSFSIAFGKLGYSYKKKKIKSNSVWVWEKIQLREWLDVKNKDNAQKVWNEVISTGDAEAEEEKGDAG